MPDARAEEGLYRHEEDRHHQQRKDDHRGHPSHNDRSERLLAFGAGASRDGHGGNAEDERETGHDNGTETHAAGFDGRLPDRAALFAQSLGEFDGCRPWPRAR